MHSLRVVSEVLLEDLTEDYNVGDSLSGSSKELLQRGKGGVRHMEESVIQGLLLITKNRNLKLMILDFSVWEDAGIWAHWNDSLDMHLTYLGPVSKAQNALFRHPELPSGHTFLGQLQGLMAWFL